MRYLRVPAVERRDVETLAGQLGKTYAPSGEVTLSDTALVDRPGTTLESVRGHRLAIHHTSASWAFLDRQEAEILSSIDGATPVAALPAGSAPFVAALYRRGLVSVNGHRAVEGEMFQDGPNYREGHLVELLVTEKCNLGCVYCLAGTNARMPSMTTETARRSIDLAFAMEEARVLAFEFSGGEPFLRFDLMQEATTYIRNHPQRRGRRIYLSVQTNGTLLNDERVAWLRDNGVSVGVSLDGQPWSQDVSRPMLGGGASYDALMRGIGLLRGAGLAFGALVVLNRSNIGSVADLLAFLAAYDIWSFKLNPVAFLGTAQRNWDRTGVTQEEVVEYFQQLVSLIAAGRAPVLEANLHAMALHLVSKVRSTRCLRGQCGAGETFQAIAADGTIYPCGRATQSPGLRLGRVDDPVLESLSAAIAGNRQVLEIAVRRPRTLEGCAACPYQELCQAGCSAQAYERYGTVRHRTPECHFFKTMYPELMYRLTFDRAAFEAFNSLGYFSAPAIRYDESLLPVACS